MSSWLIRSGYSSGYFALSQGSAIIPIPTYFLHTGTNLLTVTYVPYAASQSLYEGQSGSATVVVTPPPATAPPQFRSFHRRRERTPAHRLLLSRIRLPGPLCIKRWTGAVLRVHRQSTTDRSLSHRRRPSRRSPWPMATLPRRFQPLPTPSVPRVPSRCKPPLQLRWIPAICFNRSSCPYLLLRPSLRLHRPELLRRNARGALPRAIQDSSGSHAEGRRSSVSRCGSEPVAVKWKPTKAIVSRSEQSRLVSLPTKRSGTP
jgi:hypothetical protein